MLNSLRRRKVLRGRATAAPKRMDATRALVAALRQAEQALVALREANDEFYLSDLPTENAALSMLRRERERTFTFLIGREIIAEAPTLARLIGLRVAPGQATPLSDWMQEVTDKDLAAIEGQPIPNGEAA